MKLRIGHLYPNTMSTYGDFGNILCLKMRAIWQGIDVEIIPLEIGQDIPDSISCFFFGGGQDLAQSSVAKDLQLKANQIKDSVERGVPLLSICGGYQLLGKHYLPFGQEPLPGICLFPAETKASNDRMIGDIIIESDQSLSLVSESPYILGFENHSGKTVITDTDKAHPLGKVIKGFGNNGEDLTEGCVYKNAIGCYIHGPVLPKNPHLADWLLERAMQSIDPDYQIKKLDDSLEWKAHNYIVARYNGK